ARWTFGVGTPASLRRHSFSRGRADRQAESSERLSSSLLNLNDLDDGADHVYAGDVAPHLHYHRYPQVLLLEISRQTQRVVCYAVVTTHGPEPAFNRVVVNDSVHANGASRQLGWCGRGPARRGDDQTDQQDGESHEDSPHG